MRTLPWSKNRCFHLLVPLLVRQPDRTYMIRKISVMGNWLPVPTQSCHQIRNRFQLGTSVRERQFEVLDMGWNFIWDLESSATSSSDNAWAGSRPQLVGKVSVAFPEECLCRKFDELKRTTLSGYHSRSWRQEVIKLTSS